MDGDIFRIFSSLNLLIDWSIEGMLVITEEERNKRENKVLGIHETLFLYLTLNLSRCMTLGQPNSCFRLELLH